jgi:5'-nucleotidase / UDP-sugar diphosphatase
VLNRTSSLLLFPLFFLASSFAQGEVRKLTILHSNDLHARLLPDDKKQGGFAYLATLVKQQREICGKHCLYLNAGDLVQGTPVSTIFKGTPIYEIANRFHFDAATLGNHEFDYGYQQIPNYLKKANYPIVSANVVLAKDPAQLVTNKPYVIKKVNGIRIAIIGAAMANLVSGFLTQDRAGPWTAQPVAQTVARYAAELKREDKADFVIVLGHILRKESSEIIQSVPEVGVVVEGHDHAGRKEMESAQGKAGDRHIAVGCVGYGRELCKLELSIQMPEGRIVEAKWDRLAVDATKIAPDPSMAKIVDKWEKRVSKVMDVKIATANRDYDRAALVTLIERAFREEFKTDFGVTNRGGVRDVLSKGDVLVRNLWNICPFDNRMMVARGVKGSQLTSFVKDTEKVEPEKLYSIATSDFVVENEATRKALGLEGIRFEPTTEMMRDVVIRWVQRKGTLD